MAISPILHDIGCTEWQEGRKVRAVWWLYLLVFLGKLAEVSISSLRTQMIVKGQRLVGAILAGIEYVMWFVIVAVALNKYSSDLLMVGLLTISFALGQIIGSFIEEKMALGNCMLNGIFTSRDNAVSAADMLRANGFSLTMFSGEGIGKSERTIIIMTVRRKNLSLVKKMMHDIDSKVVISVTPMVNIEGGTMPKKIKGAL